MLNTGIVNKQLVSSDEYNCPVLNLVSCSEYLCPLLAFCILNGLRVSYNLYWCSVITLGVPCWHFDSSTSNWCPTWCPLLIIGFQCWLVESFTNHWWPLLNIVVQYILLVNVTVPVLTLPWNNVQVSAKFLGNQSLETVLLRQFPDIGLLQGGVV